MEKDGFLDQLFLRPTKDGAVLILKNLDEETANKMVRELPFYELKKINSYYSYHSRYEYITVQDSICTKSSIFKKPIIILINYRFFIVYFFITNLYI